MSGGHFNDCGYDYYKVAQFADELEEEIRNNNVEQEYGYTPNHEPEVIEYLKEQVPKMRKMAEIMRHVDYLYSGDHGDDSFMERVKEVEEKYL
jgi:alanine-alpha-ketoisovalerate/valine-pyruvate aminotransferase